jgi:hypothetical protein
MTKEAVFFYSYKAGVTGENGNVYRKPARVNGYLSGLQPRTFLDTCQRLARVMVT